MMEATLQSLFDFTREIWKYGGSVLFGALISALFSYNFTKWRENQRLKIDLQVKTVEQLLESMKVFGDASASMFIPNITSFSGYNLMLKNYKERKLVEDNSLNGILDDVNRKQVERSKDSIRQCMDSYFELWKTYSATFISIINILESKEVILNKFVGFKDILLVEYNSISKIYNDIMNLYQFEITQKIIYFEPIEEPYIASISNYDNEFMKKRIDITSILWDLKVGLQNEFLSKLFKYKVPLRKPMDKNFPVYEPGYVYKEKQNEVGI